MEKIRVFTDLVVWQRGHELVLTIYSLAKSFPTGEQYGLTSQMKRAVVSITSNIAEGFSRPTRADKVHFYHMALGSCTEIQNQLIVAKDLEYATITQYNSASYIAIEVHKLLNGLIKSVKAEK